MECFESLEIGLEPEINFYDRNFDINIKNGKIRIGADLSGGVGRLSDSCEIDLDAFLESCGRLKAEIEARSNEVANNVINPTSPQ